MKDALSPEETARTLCITEEDVQHLLKTEQLTFRKKGEGILISRKSVLEYDEQELKRKLKGMEISRLTYLYSV